MNPLARNIAAYVHYQTARNAIAWLPIFFLYMTATLSLDEAIVLESIYYAVVVALEVPSGYLSDRVGRRPTLGLAMVAWIAAPLVFATTSSFWAFAWAQVLMAAGMALNSGTDEALLFDSLAGLDQRHTYLDVETRAQTRGLLSTAVAALLGGTASLVDYRLAYLVSGLGAAIALLFVLRMTEPPRPERAAPPWQQLGAVARRVTDRALAWLLAYAVAMTVLDHVAYMFIQPYLALLSLPPVAGAEAAPLWSGVVTAAALVVGALASRWAPTLARVLGCRGTLLGALVIHGLVIVAMAAVVHPLVVVLVALRSVPPAVWRPVAHGVAHPKVPSSIRATYFSVESLAGRLAFSASLVLAATVTGSGQAADEGMLSTILTGFALAAGVAFLGLLATSRAVSADGDGQAP